MNIGIAFAGLAALLYGTSLFVMKRWFADYSSPTFLSITYAISMVLYLPVVVAADGPFLPASNRVSVLGAIFAVTALTALAMVFLFRALRIGEVSYVSPISKIIPVFVLPLEVGLLRQQLSALQVGGVVVATIAIYVANWEGTTLLAPIKRASRSRPAQLALLSAATFAVVDVGKRVLMQELAIAPTTYVPLMFFGIAGLMGPLAIRARWPDDWWRDLPFFVVTALVIAAGNHVVLLSFQRLPASIVSPVVNGQAIVAVILGAIFLEESHLRTRLAATGLAILGITMISLG
ncbi:DMT family transporter [Haloterrigena salifodinae]|uniref:DMT family transporter n=1 Tax=Haloterrigena salifodinae TaxID=2675099 RepID=UPI001E2ABD58|nr:DMT family transporter [Haloterrigena salifodinae]